MNGPIHILLVEDDSDDYRLIAKQLRGQSRNIEIDWAESVSEATDKLNQASYGVVLTDLSLPDSSGLKTVSTLRAKCRSLPIIVLTSLNDECMEEDLLEAGAQDYLVKGELSGRAVLRAITHAMQRQQLFNECQNLLAEREQSRQLLQQQAALLKKKNRRLRRLYKTAQEFVDNVSHDFRTPLTVVKDYVAIIREGMVGEINDEQRTMLDKVSVRADDLNNMVDDLLDISKLEAGLLGAWRRNNCVASIVERVESMLRQRAQVKNVNFTVECEPDLPLVYCDADMIGRVITNLAVNAIKFSGENGQVRLRAEADPAGRQVVVGIADNGPGIDSESLSKIFDRFRQLESGMKPTVKGFGLGLNIANQLCRINLGELSVQSRVGVGSTFSFTIPFADPLEVFRRWLKTLCSTTDSLQLTEILVPESVAQDNANEFDSFVNCMLRKRDLLFRTSKGHWLFIMAAPSSELGCWSQRMQQAFRKHNRNRPMGPLPDYHTVVRHQWTSVDMHDSILSEFAEVLHQASGATVPM